MVGAQSQAKAAAALISLSIACASCKSLVVHYEWSADRRHLVRVIEEGIDQFVERDGNAEPSYRAIGVESMILSADGAHLAYPGMTASGWEVVYDGRRSKPWRGIGAIVLSEDGRHIAYAALDDGGWRVVRDGTLGPILDAIMANTIALSPDGRHLAYVGERGGISHLFYDDRSYGGFSLIGRPIFSSDSRHLAFVAARGRSVRVHLDGQQQPQFEEIVELCFSSDGAHLGYFGLREDRWYAVIDGTVGEGFELLAALRFSAKGRALYLAKEKDRWHAVLGGERIATHAEIAHRSVCFTGEVPRFAVKDQLWSIGDGPRFEGISALVCSKERFAYVGQREGRAIVMDGDRELGRYERVDQPIFSDDGRKLGFIAIDEEGAFVQIDDRRFEVTLPLFETLALSADGAHFALLSGDRKAKRLELIVDGTAVRPFDFEEPAALALKNPRALTLDLLRRWVEAELLLTLEERGTSPSRRHGLRRSSDGAHPETQHE